MKWLIIGLGNPGKQYENTRHNVGFTVVETMAKKISTKTWRLEKKFKGQVIEAGEILLLKPQTFMNLSGRAVKSAMNFFKLSAEQVIVVHDDLDIIIGEVKAGMEKGPKVHNGLTSIEEQLGTNHFWRVRVGVEGRNAEERKICPGERYVLLSLKPEDKEIMDRSVMMAVNKIKEIVK